MALQFRFAPHMIKLPSNPIHSLLPLLSEPGFISFAPGAPAADTFPYDDIADITNGLLENNPVGLLQYGTVEGYPPARAAMAKLISGYGLSPKPDEIVVTTGGQQAINLLSKLFMEPGDVALVESPTYSATLQILKSYRAQPIHLEADKFGFIPEDLEDKIDIFQPKFVYLIPTFKNPSGETISLERRAAAAEITGRKGVLLIEDDPYRDLRYEGETLPTIKSFDRAGNVAFITSTSKILCPGLRVGAVYMPEGMFSQMSVAKQAEDMHSSTLPQAIVAEYINRGLLAPHIKKICGAYGAKLRLIRKAMAEFFPEYVCATDPQGGFFIWCSCPEGTDTCELLNKIMEEKVAFIPGDQFFADGSGRNTFRLNFSNAAAGDIEKGIEILGRFLRKHVKTR